MRLCGPDTFIDRFEAKIFPLENGCWYWAGVKNNQGYGYINQAGRSVSVHRLSYSLCHGPIPAGMTIDHLCRNRACVNPHHLEVVSQKENTHRGETIAARNSKKTHCLRGHEFTDDNTYINRGRRCCRACAWLAGRETYRRKHPNAVYRPLKKLRKYDHFHD